MSNAFARNNRVLNTKSRIVHANRIAKLTATSHVGTFVSRTLNGISSGDVIGMRVNTVDVRLSGLGKMKIAPATGDR